MANKKCIKMVGRKFGRWTVLEKNNKRASNGAVQWLCVCDCGVKRVVSGGGLRGGGSKSCGCYSREIASSSNLTHGHSKKENKTKIYQIWSSIKDRCLNSNCKSYKDYGGRGITICDQWKKSFEIFFRDVGEPPKGKSIDRIDNDGDYKPSNIKWSTSEEQSHNRRSTKLCWSIVNNIRSIYSISDYTYKEMGLRYNLSPSTIWEIIHNKIWRRHESTI